MRIRVFLFSFLALTFISLTPSRAATFEEKEKAVLRSEERLWAAVELLKNQSKSEEGQVLYRLRFQNATVHIGGIMRWMLPYEKKLKQGDLEAQKVTGATYYDMIEYGHIDIPNLLALQMSFALAISGVDPGGYLFDGTSKSLAEAIAGGHVKSQLAEAYFSQNYTDSIGEKKFEWDKARYKRLVKLSEQEYGLATALLAQGEYYRSLNKKGNLDKNSDAYKEYIKWMHTAIEQGVYYKAMLLVHSWEVQKKMSGNGK